MDDGSLLVVGFGDFMTKMKRPALRNGKHVMGFDALLSVGVRLGPTENTRWFWVRLSAWACADRLGLVSV